VAVKFPSFSCSTDQRSAGYQAKLITQHQKYEDSDRKADTQGQRFHRSVASAVITGKKKEAGKQAADHANQQDKDDELEHCRLQ